MFAFQNRALRPVNNVLQANNKLANQTNQPDLKKNLIKNISKPGLLNDENSLVDKKFQSKIPVFKSRIPVSFHLNPEKSACVSVKPNIQIENIDKESNCFLLSDYAPEIYKYLHDLEKKQCLKANFLSVKNVLTSNMRAILINWIISVHHSFQLTAETLYLCISVIDRFFAREAVSKSRIQLVGATSLFIASKFEEIYYPDVNEFVAVCDNLYTKKDILRMELKILEVINFELGRPLPIHFLRRGSKAAHADGKTHMLAKYLCELVQVYYECAHWNPSLLAATSLYVSLRLMDRNEENESVWTPTVAHYTYYSEEEVVKHSSVICRLIIDSETSKFQNCRRKFSTSKYMEISKFSPSSMKLIKQIAGSK